MTISILAKNRGQQAFSVSSCCCQHHMAPGQSVTDLQQTSSTIQSNTQKGFNLEEAGGGGGGSPTD